MGNYVFLVSFKWYSILKMSKRERHCRTNRINTERKRTGAPLGVPAVLRITKFSPTSSNEEIKACGCVYHGREEVKSEDWQLKYMEIHIKITKQIKENLSYTKIPSLTHETG